MAHWYGIRDGDWRAWAMLNDHYSARHYRDGRRPAKVMGPGEYMLLMTLDSLAVFGWLRNRRDDDQDGISCALFRNVGPHRSSDLIREADQLAWERWEDRRHFTYVNPRKVRSLNPGYCFLQAGWTRVGRSKSGLHLLAIEGS